MRDYTVEREAKDKVVRKLNGSGGLGFAQHWRCKDWLVSRNQDISVFLIYSVWEAVIARWSYP